MKMTTILGGVASSAVIVAMAVIYMAADVNAAIPTDELPEFKSAPMIEFEPVVVLPSLAPTESIRPRKRPNQLLPKHVYNEDQLYCLAQNIYFESRGEIKAGQAAVAWVTLNRVLDNEHPDTICDVVWEDSQFSWTHDGKSDTPKDKAAWKRAQALALQIVDSYDPNIDPTEGSTYFHEQSISPGWSDDFKRVSQIGNHIFYTDRG